MVSDNQIVQVLAGCSRDAMSARRDHAAILAKQQQQQKQKQQQQSADVEIGSEATHPGDEGSLRRWEELLKSADAYGGRWRSDVVGADSAGVSLIADAQENRVHLNPF